MPGQESRNRKDSLKEHFEGPRPKWACGWCVQFEAVIPPNISVAKLTMIECGELNENEQHLIGHLSIDLHRIVGWFYYILSGAFVLDAECKGKLFPIPDSCRW